MADETKKYLDYEGLKHLVEKLTDRIQAVGKGDYLPLSGGSLTGNLEIHAELLVGGPTTLEESVMMKKEVKFMGEANAEFHAPITAYEDALFNGVFTANSKATFAGGTYIDTSGHIHLPSGVEIY